MVARFQKQARGKSAREGRDPQAFAVESAGGLAQWSEGAPAPDRLREPISNSLSPIPFRLSDLRNDLPAATMSVVQASTVPQLQQDNEARPLLVVAIIPMLVQIARQPDWIYRVSRAVGVPLISHATTRHEHMHRPPRRECLLQYLHVHPLLVSLLASQGFTRHRPGCEAQYMYVRRRVNTIARPSWTGRREGQPAHARGKLSTPLCSHWATTRLYMLLLSII